MTPALLRSDALDPTAIDRALREAGGFLLAPSGEERLFTEALSAARSLFALPVALKAEAAIERSRHFHGWSELHNERDWREQFHLGRELPPPPDGPPPHRRLEGPNLWPAGERERPALLLRYQDAVATLGHRVLDGVARALELPAAAFAGVGHEGYAVMKLIGYHPQAVADAATGHARPGVAAHVDFSFLTLTLQDSPGLEVCGPDRVWTLVEPRPGALWVHAGELLELATAGRYRATPHRVVNRSVERTRISIPFFLNPPLGGTVAPLVGEGSDLPGGGSHVHRVLAPDSPRRPLHFGEAEWRRKGENRWCHLCAAAGAPPG
jgi:isopenicillin N synthase-like dioxygenase